MKPVKVDRMPGGGTARIKIGQNGSYTQINEVIYAFSATVFFELIDYVNTLTNHN